MALTRVRNRGTTTRYGELWFLSVYPWVHLPPLTVYQVHRPSYA